MDDGTATVRGLTIGTGVYKMREWPAGVLGSAAIRADDQPKPRQDGLIPGGDHSGGRMLSFRVEVDAGSQALSEAAAFPLMAAFAAAEADEWLDVRLTGSPFEYSLRGRCRGVDMVLSRERFTTNGLIPALCHFMATDPILYGPEQSVLISLVDPGEGLTFPVTFPIVFSGGGSGSGTGSAPNDGTKAVTWVATLTGPLLNPRLALAGSGMSVRVAATIAAGQTLVLDSATGSMLLNGTSPRPSWEGSGTVWWKLAPDANSVLFTADAGTGTASVSWHPGLA